MNEAFDKQLKLTIRIGVVISSVTLIVGAFLFKKYDNTAFLYGGLPLGIVFALVFLKIRVRSLMEELYENEEE